MATINLSVKYRPVKIGFLVREGNTDDLVKAAGINTLLWGGIYNPIIPVSLNKDFADRLISLFSVDVLHPVEHTKEIDELLSKYPFLKEHPLYNEDIFYKDYTTKNILSYLASINIVNKYWEKELKHKSKTFKSNCALIRWEDSDNLRNLFSISFGYFPSAYNLRDNFESAFLKGLRSKEIKILPNKSIDGEIANNIYPLLLTRSDLQSYGSSFRSYRKRKGIYIGNETDFDDLVYFWNLRASGVTLEFLPKNYIQRFDEFIKAHLAKLDKVPNHNPNIEDWVTLYHRIENEAELQEIIKKFSTTKRTSISHCSDVIWNGLNIKPATFYFQWGHALANAEKSYNRYVVAINLPDKKFISDTGLDMEWQNLVVSIDSSWEFGYSEHTLKPPFIRELNEFYSREIAVEPWKLRAEKDGIGVMIKAHDNLLTLYPLSHQALIRKIFEFAGIKPEISQAGLITNRIIEKLEGVDGGRVFKIGGVRKLFKNLTQDKFISRQDAERIIRSGAEFTKHETLYIESREKEKLEPSDVFDFLLKKDFLKAGLALICNDCKLKSWLSLKRLGDLWGCDYCGYENKTGLHLKKSLHEKGEGDWKFRKSGLFAKDNNQEGAIPVILTLLVFVRIFKFTLAKNFIYSPSLKLNFESKECEIDFCVLTYEEDGRIELGIGECKSEGGKINQNDVDNLKSIRDKFSTKDIDCYLVFSKTVEQFDSDEIDLFRTLLGDRIPCILLTNRELEPYHPYWEERDETLPYKHALTLNEMACNSEHIYLTLKKS